MWDNYRLVKADPAVGVLYIINDFLSGHVRLRGRPNGAYPYKYLEMIDALFGKAENTIEVCSGDSRYSDAFTVDCRIETNPDMWERGEELHHYYNEQFDRWRCDPPYNEDTAQEMYGCHIPSFSKLLKAGAHVVKPGSLLFLLCAQNYQVCPKELKRIGLITMSIVPNNELRALNIYVKL